jgi:hypothetical protein
MNILLEKFLHDNWYPDYALYAYYMGALFWIITYAMVIYRIVKHKFLEFPAIVIAANVSWELLWGFVFNFAFGGPILQYAWRLGFFLDVFMLYSAFRFAKDQVDIPHLKEWMKFTVPAVFLFFLGAIYFYVIEGFDLPMGFNSGMFLNLFMGVLCLLFLLRRPNYPFSLWIGIGRFIATDVFFTIYIYNVRQHVYLSIYLCWTCIVVDLIYIIALLHFRKKRLENPAAMNTNTAIA